MTFNGRSAPLAYNIKEHFPQHEEGTNITSNKYVYETAFTEVLGYIYTCGALYCTDVKVGLLENEIAVGSYINKAYVAYCMD